MGLFGFGADPGRTTGSMRLGALEAEAQKETDRLEAMRSETKERDEDRRLLMQVLRDLKPGQHPRTLAETFFEACRDPLDLSTFYLALVDYETDRMAFPFYFEGGKHRNSRPAVFSQHGGLTVRAMSTREPLYYATKESQEAHGVVYSEAERITGLIPESWFGVPLGVGEGWEGRPFGLISFQSFRVDAFSPSRRALMQSLSAVLALALKADRERRLSL